MTSQARIDANRRNAARSTGPRTAEGKARSRLNGLTHGLRSAEVVLPTEDKAAFDAHLGAWLDDWRPPTMARRHLVERLAVGAWRLRRCVRIETQRLSDRVDEALARSTRRRDAELDRLLGQLGQFGQGPLAVVDELETTRDGIGRFQDEWRAILDAATEPGGWNDPKAHNVRYFNLLGYFTSDEEVVGRVQDVWCLLLVARPDLARDEDDLPLPPDEAEELLGAIRQTAREQIERLDGLLESAADVRSALARRAEADAFDPRPEDAALLRYEGQLDREFRSGLTQLVKLTQTGADLVDEAEPASPSEPDPDEVPAPAAPTEPNPTAAEPPAEAAAPTEPNAAAPTLTLVQATPGLDGPSLPLGGGAVVPEPTRSAASDR